LLAQALLRGGAQTVRQEVPVAVAKDDVRNDLLVRRVVLDLRPRPERVALADHRLKTIQVLADESMPRAVGKDVVPLHAQDLLVRRFQSPAIRIRPRPKTAISSAVRSTSSSRTGRK